MSKYYKRETVIYKFKLEQLSRAEFKDLNEAQRRILWKVFLLTLLNVKKVSQHQANTWLYPKKELNLNNLK